MKTLLSILLILPILSFSQADDPENIVRNKEAQNEENEKSKDSLYVFNFPKDVNGNILYTNVVKVENTSAQDLYSRAKLCIAEVYKSNKEVTQLNDDAAKVILIKPVIKSYAYSAWTGGFNTYTNYQLKIECKDGRYRYTIDGFAITLSTKSGSYGPYSVEYKLIKPYMARKSALQVQKNIDLEIRAIIQLLSKHMNTAIADF